MNVYRLLNTLMKTLQISLHECILVSSFNSTNIYVYCKIWWVIHLLCVHNTLKGCYVALKYRVSYNVA